jgi:hypothetical protein
MRVLTKMSGETAQQISIKAAKMAVSESLRLAEMQPLK